MRKKILSLFMSSIMTVSLLTGCSGSGVSLDMSKNDEETSSDKDNSSDNQNESDDEKEMILIANHLQQKIRKLQ